MFKKIVIKLVLQAIVSASGLIYDEHDILRFEKLDNSSYLLVVEGYYATITESHIHVWNGLEINELFSLDTLLLR